MEGIPHFYAPDRDSWRRWLEENHTDQSGVWLVFDKGPGRTMTWADIVQEALCFGWIDSRPGKVSDTQSKIYVSKRKPKSVWSRINKAHVEALIANGLMRPAGMVAIETAKQNGSWDALNLSDDLVYPPELVNAFDQSSIAKQNFELFPVSSRRNALQWIYDAKTPETRQKRVDEIVQSAESNVRLR